MKCITYIMYIIIYYMLYVKLINSQEPSITLQLLLIGSGKFSLSINVWFSLSECFLFFESPMIAKASKEIWSSDKPDVLKYYTWKYLINGRKYKF